VAAAGAAAAAGGEEGKGMGFTLRGFGGVLLERLVTLAAACVLALAPMAAARANQGFDSPEAAMAAFGEAVLRGDEAALKSVLGADFRRLIPPVGADVRERFLKAWEEKHAIEDADDKSAHIAVGNDGWTLPIPLVKSDTRWRFDTRAGVEEMRVRRIGRNELAVMQTLLAICDAQREYASENHGGGVLKYATKLRSSPGKKDGLYWPTQPGEKPSPLGPAVAAAGSRAGGPDGYHGYHYKLLTRQGPHASGGALDYMVRGNLFGGFAILAWPVRYWDTGVMSFMVNHEGQIYERDLGPDSAAKAAAITRFDPGPGWRKVEP
jgi:hypothetical protein